MNHELSFSSILAALLILLSSCSPSPSAVPTAELTPSAPLKPEPIATVTSAATPYPRLTTTSTQVLTIYPQPNLSKRPLIFFGALPYPHGSLDFMSLFAEKAQWNEAARHVQVFNLFGGWVAHFPWEPAESSDQELQSIIADLNRRGIAIGFEASPLVATDECGRGVEGFFGPEEGLRIVNRLKKFGANVSYVSLDEPFAFGHIYDGPSACHWSPEKIAQQVREYIMAIKSVYPDAIIGDNEPLWAGVDVQELIEWLDIYRRVTGSSFPFIHLDLDYSRPDWYIAAKQLEKEARVRDVEFGIFYLGDAGDTTDAEWLNKAFERARVYEVVTGGKPDHVIFESWNDRPDYVLPESNPDTFTALINRYFRTRTILSLNLISIDSDQTQHATGMLTDPMNVALPNAAIELTMRALEGPGLVAEYSISGTVPVGAIRSDIGFRVNTECGCQATSDFILYRVRYSEQDETVSRVLNSNFSSGLNDWGVWGSGSILLERSDQGNGMMLHIKATSMQDAAINSASFKVTPNAAYTLTFAARISPASFGSGYFDITFQDANGEIKREMIQLESGVTPIGTAITDEQGRYEIDYKSLPLGKLLIEANYIGNENYWPAYISIEYPNQ
jgi:hypothetical protein